MWNIKRFSTTTEFETWENGSHPTNFVTLTKDDNVVHYPKDDYYLKSSDSEYLAAAISSLYAIGIIGSKNGITKDEYDNLNMTYSTKWNTAYLNSTEWSLGSSSGETYGYDTLTKEAASLGFGDALYYNPMYVFLYNADYDSWQNIKCSTTSTREQIEILCIGFKVGSNTTDSYALMLATQYPTS